MDHGRKKVKNSAEAIQQKREKESAKIVEYRALVDRILELNRKRDTSKEALDLTTKLASLNPEFYTVWNYRRRIILSSDTDKQVALTSELDFTVSLVRSHPKCYWIWNHRKWALQTIPEPNWKQEFYLVSKMLELDSRNFHGWNYRRYVVAKMEEISQKTLTKQEFDFTTEKINQNFSNFSAWHNRTKLLPKLMKEQQASAAQRSTMVEREFGMIQNAIYTEPNDQSGWLYHRWLVGHDVYPISILDIYMKAGTIFIIFDVKVRLGTQMTIQAGGMDVECKCTPNTESYAYIWKLEPRKSLKEGDQVSITIDQVTSSKPACRLVSPIKRQAIVSSSSAGWTRFKDVSQHTEDASKLCLLSGQDTIQQSIDYSERVRLLEREIGVVTELLELEPNSKWCLQSAAYYLEQLEFLLDDDAKCVQIKDEVEAMLKRLLQLDMFRRGYFEDWMSTVTFSAPFYSLVSRTKDSIVQYRHREDAPKSIKVGGKLTHIPCAAIYANPSIEKLDLSDHALRDMKFMSDLLFMKKINLSGNRISTVILADNFALVDLQRNSIADYDQLQKACEAYQGDKLSIDLRGNPVCDGRSQHELIGHVTVQFQ